MTARLALALAVARRLAAAPFSPTPAAKLPSASPTRCFAIGDPQATAAQFFGTLESAGILGEDGFLAPDALLISIGDHFDFKFPDPDAAGLEGLAILSWLAGHAPSQARILLGNHDLARVQEMGALDDATFRRARELGRRAKSKDAAEAEAARDAFEVEFPDFPSPEVAGRDYSSYSTAQRRLVRELLLEGRGLLATTAKLGSEEALFTHAGASLRDLQLLGISGERAPSRIAAAINAALHAGVEKVRAAWLKDEQVKLDLAPLHIAGTAGREGGGLLYHRPANPERRGADKQWEFDDERPRRFDPRTLPPGLRQVCGHTGHPKCLEELVPWFDRAALEGEHPLRTLLVEGATVRYLAGIVAPPAGAAALHLIDGTLHRATRYELLRLDGP